jgi:hypothetical protein
VNLDGAHAQPAGIRGNEDIDAFQHRHAQTVSAQRRKASDDAPAASVENGGNFALGSGQ